MVVEAGKELEKLQKEIPHELSSLVNDLGGYSQMEKEAGEKKKLILESLDQYPKLKEEKEQFLALIVKIQSENEELKQLKERVSELDISFLVQMMWSNFSIQKLDIYSQVAEQLQKLQQLLKDDIK